MNRLPLCRMATALKGHVASARRFERILVRHRRQVNEYREEKRGSERTFPKWSGGYPSTKGKCIENAGGAGLRGLRQHVPKIRWL